MKTKMNWSFGWLLAPLFFYAHSAHAEKWQEIPDDARGDVIRAIGTALVETPYRNCEITSRIGFGGVAFLENEQTRVAFDPTTVPQYAEENLDGQPAFRMELKQSGWWNIFVIWTDSSLSRIVKVEVFQSELKRVNEGSLIEPRMTIKKISKSVMTCLAKR